MQGDCWRRASVVLDTDGSKDFASPRHKAAHDPDLLCAQTALDAPSNRGFMEVCISLTLSLSP